MARYRAGIETRGRILDATRALLSEVGLEGTTLKAICERAGIGAGSFYNLFDAKEEAVLSVVREAIAAVDPARADGDEDERVADLVDAYLAFITGEPGLARIYLQAAASWGLADPSLGARFAGHQQRRLERLAAALGRELPDLAPEAVRNRAELLLAALNGLTVSWLLDPGVDLPGHRDRLLAAVAAPLPDPSRVGVGAARG